MQQVTSFAWSEITILRANVLLSKAWQFECLLIHGKIHSSQTLAIEHDFGDVGLDDVGLDHQRR